MKRALAALLIVAALIISGCLKWSPTPQFQVATNVPLTTVWQLDLPEGVTADAVDSVSLVDGARFLPVSVQRAGKRLGLTPHFPYERGARFNVRIFLKDGSRHDATVAAGEFPEVPVGQIVEVPAVPGLGFYYPYFLYIPEGMPKDGPRRLLVEPNSTAISDDLLHHIERARAQLALKKISREIADELKIPVLVPVFPRIVRGTATHDLNRETLLIADGPLKRIDLQLLAMLADARQVLTRNGVQTEAKVLMQGYTDSGHFANRFAMLHPEAVRAVAAGAVDGVLTLPAAAYQGLRLRYPVGLADIEEITGKPFNPAEYRQIAHYFQMGELDTNDRTLQQDVYAPADAALIRQLFGAKMMPDRWQRTQALYRELGATAQFVTYKGSGQQPGPTRDLIAFFRANGLPESKGALTPITPTQP